MIDYVNEKWLERLHSIDLSGGKVEERIASVTADYVRFLCENPHFRAMLIIKETGLDSPVRESAAGLSVPVKRLFVIYGRKLGLSRSVLRERIFIVRSLVYGSAIMLGEEAYVDESRLAMLYRTVFTALE